MRARVRRLCALISVACTLTLLVLVWGAGPDEVTVWTGLLGIVTGAAAWRLDERPKAEVPPL